MKEQIKTINKLFVIPNSQTARLGGLTLRGRAGVNHHATLRLTVLLWDGSIVIEICPLRAREQHATWMAFKLAASVQLLKLNIAAKLRKL